MNRNKLAMAILSFCCVSVLAGCKSDGLEGAADEQQSSVIEQSQNDSTDQESGTPIGDDREEQTQDSNADRDEETTPSDEADDSDSATEDDSENAGEEALSGIDRALQTGNPAFLPATRSELEARILSDLEAAQVEQVSFFESIYGDQEVQYDPGRSSSLVYAQGLAGNYPLVLGNKGKTLAAASENDGARSAAFGSNILRTLNDGGNSSYQGAMRKVLSWLMNEVSPPASAKVAFTLIDTGSYNKSRAWLATQFPAWDIVRCDTQEQLQSCLSNGVDLVITGSNQSGMDTTTIANAFSSLQQQKVPMLYVHLHSWNTSSLTNTVLQYLGFSMPTPGSAGNYWSQDKAVWSDYTEMLASSSPLDALAALISDFYQNATTVDLINCGTDSTVACNQTPAIQQVFYQPANYLRNMIKGFDQKNRDIFAESGLELEKLLILLADKYRSQIVYPMDRTATPTNEFLRAYFADHLVYNSRRYNPVPSDLGNFSRTDFSHVSTLNKALDYTSKPNFRSAGVYALPGQTVKVTRLDNNAVSTSIFVNSLRSSSTHEFDRQAYKRPKFLQSVKLPVRSGESTSFTSPYGGPIQIAFNANEIPVRLKFENVGEHPYWNGPEDNAAFDAAIARGDFDWAEVVTPGFEVHSTLEKMRKTVSNPNWNTGSKLAEATRQYVHNYPHVLAGFKGPGIDVLPEVHDFAEARGWEVPHIDIVKHMNADQPTCGAGCSGNPYDAGWAFSPTGHGDLHELGHGLEKSRLKFEGREGHATTNFYSYYSKSKYEDETGNTSSCQNLPFEDMFSKLKSSLNSADPYAYMQSQNSYMNKWNTGVGLMIQVMMATQDQSNVLSDGWMVIPRLHLMNREFDLARKNDDSWLAGRDALGFSTYSRSQANMMQNNDFLLISLAQATGLDFSDFFNMWGLRLSQSAIDSLSGKGLKRMPLKFYAPETSKAYCSDLDAQAVEMTAGASWPHN